MFTIAAVVTISIVTYNALNPIFLAKAGVGLTATQAATIAGAGAGLVSGAAAGVASAAFSGASFMDSIKAGVRGAVIGGVGAGAFTYIGESLQGFEQILAHGATGGVLSVLQGGKFGHGFVSAGLTKLASKSGILGTKGTDIMRVIRVTAAGILGGAIASITGGKFANGAISAAMGQALNAEKNIPDSEVQKDEKLIKSVNIGVTIKGPKGTSGTLTTDEASNISLSGEQKNSIVTTSVDSNGLELKLTPWQKFKSFVKSLVPSSPVNSDGNIVIGKSIEIKEVVELDVEVELDVSVPVKKIAPSQQDALSRRMCEHLGECQ